MIAVFQFQFQVFGNCHQQNELFHVSHMFFCKSAISSGILVQSFFDGRFVSTPLTAQVDQAQWNSKLSPVKLATATVTLSLPPLPFLEKHFLTNFAPRLIEVVEQRADQSDQIGRAHV